jgi:hypothetical protein
VAKQRPSFTQLVLPTREVFEHGPLLLQTRSRPSKYMTILPVKGVAHLSGDEGMAVIIKRVAWYGTKRVT